MPDILVLGATGFTGRLITRYLYAHHDHGSRFTFTIGARSKSKLDALVSELSLDTTVDVIVVDVTKPEQVEAAVRKAKVVINAVGPYMRWGTPVVDACVRYGIHYVDLSGETFWVRDIIAEYDYAATKTGAIIIPCLGIDSVPSDIVIYLANTTLKALAGPDTAIENSTTAWDVRGGLSGGTLHTSIAGLEEVPREKLQASFRDYVLSPVEGLPRPPPQLVYALPYSSVRGSFFPMSGINCAVVQRTWGLHELDARRVSSRMHDNAICTPDNQEMRKQLTYGHQFKYDEFITMPNAAVAVMATIALAIGLASLTFIRPAGSSGVTVFANHIDIYFYPDSLAVQEVVDSTRPRSIGRVASLPPASTLLMQTSIDRKMKTGFFRLTNITSSVPTDTTPLTLVKTVMFGKEDPYVGSAVMISEATLALNFDTDKLPALARTGGVLTPMSGLGNVLIDRLKETGRFEFSSEIFDPTVKEQD